TSTNLLTAAQAGHDTGLRCWAFTGPAPNPLADRCHDALAVPSPDSQVVQELHLVSTHLLCEYVDQALPLIRQLPTASVPAPRAGTFARWAPPPVTAGTGRDGANGHPTNGHGANGHGSTGTGLVRS
ncbi:phosphoheptose isomerase, partial [Micromonospora sp. NPDC004551]